MHVITAAELDAWFDWDSLIVRLREAFRDECDVPPRHQHPVPVPGAPDATLLLMPAWVQGAFLGVKVATVFPGNRQRGLPAVMGNYYLANANTGEPLAVIDGSALTPWRTAAASALAARYLARPDSHTLLMVGTGRLAPYLIRAHCAVRPIRKVLVWGRSRAKAEATAAALALERVGVEPVENLATAVAASDVVSCATLATEPLVHGAWLRPGSHVDLVGGFKPHMREADDAAIRRATVFVDTRAGALSEAGDIIAPIEAGVLDAGGIAAELGELARGHHHGRESAEQITLFKSVGYALEDLAAARLAYERARAAH